MIRKEQHKAVWRLSETPSHFPVVEIDLPEPQPNLSSELTCSECRGLMRLFRTVSEFPFAVYGMIVRFNNRLIYLCNGCGYESTAGSNLQADVMSTNLDFIADRLDESGQLLLPSSRGRLKNILS